MRSVTVHAGPKAANSKVPAQRPTKEVSMVDKMGPVTLTAAKGAAKRSNSNLGTAMQLGEI